MLRVALTVTLCAGLSGGAAAQSALAPDRALTQPAATTASAPQASDEATFLTSPALALDHVYALAKGDDRQAANRFANAALARFTDSAPLWEAAGYVRRGAGDYAAALEAYRRAAELDPANPNVWKGQALMLRKLGAIAPAAELIAQHPGLGNEPELRTILTEQAAFDLRSSDSLEDAAERTRRLEGVAARLDQLIQAGGGELEAARRAEAAPFDRIQASVLLHRDADAVDRYERLDAAGIDVPAYARYQAALAYARLRQSARAVSILRRLVQERADDIDSQLELFYALVDLDRVDEARSRIDALEQRLSSQPGRGEDLLRVRIAAAMARAYDEHPAPALAKLDRLLEEAPFNADARADRATVYFWRGWTRRARAEADAVTSVEPRNADALSLQIQSDIALDDWIGARAALRSDDTRQSLRSRDLLDLSQRLSWHDRPDLTIESGYGTGSQTNVATYQDWMVDTRAYSAPIDDRLRLFAHLRDVHTDIRPAALNRLWGGAGLEVTRRALSGSLELAGVQGEPAPALVARAAWQPLDGARLTAQAASSDPDTPARASSAGIREHTVLLGSGYDWNESTGVGADLGYGRFTDTNQQWNGLARFSQRLAASARAKLTWNTYVGYAHDTLAAARAPYFDPAHATSEDTELRGEWLAAHDPTRHRSLWHVLTLSAGGYQQAGFGGRPTYSVRYEPRWTLSNHSELGLGITHGEHPYDGREETRTSVAFSYEGRF